jgi:hypothetical protein
MGIPLWRHNAGGLDSLIVKPSGGTGGAVAIRYCDAIPMEHRVICSQLESEFTFFTDLDMSAADGLFIGMRPPKR